MTFAHRKQLHILKSVWDRDFLLHGKGSCYVQMLNFEQQYWFRRKKFKEFAQSSLWETLIRGPALPKLSLATYSFLWKCMAFQKTVESTREVISKLEKNQICLESCPKKSSFIILPSRDFVERQLYNLVHSSDKLCIQRKHFCTPKPISLLEEDIQRNLIISIIVGFYYFRLNKVYQIWKEKLKYWDTESCER